MISRYYVTRGARLPPVKSDPQRHLVYAMERKIIGWTVHTTMPVNDLLDVAIHACKKYDADVPEIKIINKPKLRVFGYSDHKITLNAGYNGQNLSTFLHELAHWLQDEVWHQTNDWDLICPQEDHGPEFMAIYIHLLDQYKMMPRNQMIDLCDECGIIYDEPKR